MRQLEEVGPWIHRHPGSNPFMATNQASGLRQVMPPQHLRCPFGKLGLMTAILQG